MRPLYLLFTVYALLASANLCSAEPLATAQALANGELHGWTYGTDPAKKQIDCVQFVARVLEKELARPLSKAEADAVSIRPAPSDLAAAVTSGAPLTKGVQHALIDLIKRGSVVAVVDVKPGDLIQYWIKSASGAWLGHSGVVSKVSQDAQKNVRVNLLGSHESTGGVGDNDFGHVGLNLSDPARFVYIARFK